MGFQHPICDSRSIRSSDGACVSGRLTVITLSFNLLQLLFFLLYLTNWIVTVVFFSIYESESLCNDWDCILNDSLGKKSLCVLGNSLLCSRALHPATFFLNDSWPKGVHPALIQLPTA